jgi:hypothetical protein
MLTLLYPRWKSFGRKYTSRLERKKQLHRLTVVILFMVAIFFLANHILYSVKQANLILSFPIILLIAPLSFLFGAIAFFSSIFCNLIYFFQARDTEQLIASPIHPTQYFLQRLLLVTSTSYWMALILVAPIVTATCFQYHDRLVPLAACAVGLLPSLLLPIATSYCIVTLSLYLIPIKFLSRGLKTVMGLGLGWVLCNNLLGSTSSNSSESLDPINLLTTFQPAFSPYSPSYWIARILSLCYEGKDWDLGSILLVASSTGGVLVLASLVHEICYTSSYANYHNPWRLRHKGQTNPSSRLTKSLSRLSPIARTELLQFARLPGQILTIGAYSVLLLVTIKQSPSGQSIYSTDGSWNQLGQFLSLLIVNVAQFSIYCATLTRTSYISPSIEGEGAWIVEKAPTALYNVLIEKFKCWRNIYRLATSVSSLFALWILGISFTFIPLQLVLCLAFCDAAVLCSIVSGTKSRDVTWDHLHQLTISTSAAFFSLKALGITATLLVAFTILFTLQVLAADLLPSRCSWLSEIIIGLLGYGLVRLTRRRGFSQLSELGTKN